ncbi:hypothetical protein UABAM_05551 [Candidatus Uabimicrobium amorphum]|uniref:Uncharacterized protein n=1 Tax=Uabimicrobium amorphum TaxID=2596890 RepID=A0A5S9IS55_UABAM|nr:hypothetical protein UABAM_05551 [Candidatus Uabimicrobium amorphum]
MNIHLKFYLYDRIVSEIAGGSSFAAAYAKAIKYNYCKQRTANVKVKPNENNSVPDIVNDFKPGITKIDNYGNFIRKPQGFAGVIDGKSGLMDIVPTLRTGLRSELPSGVFPVTRTHAVLLNRMKTPQSSAYAFTIFYLKNRTLNIGYKSQSVNGRFPSDILPAKYHPFVRAHIEASTGLKVNVKISVPKYYYIPWAIPKDRK